MKEYRDVNLDYLFLLASHQSGFLEDWHSILPTKEMVAAENDCQSGNNKSKIGSGRASPAVSSLRIHASVKSSFTTKWDSIQDTIGELKTFLGIVCERGESPFNEPVTVVANSGRSLGQFNVLP